jgi:hypothetical protein
MLIDVEILQLLRMGTFSLLSHRFTSWYVLQDRQ